MKKYIIISLLMASCLLFSGCLQVAGGAAVIAGTANRYATQATYTSLQEAAKSISNYANSSISDANQIGKVSSGAVSGKKSGGELKLTLSGDVKTSDDYKADVADSDSAGTRFAKRFYASLVKSLPDGSSFYVKIDGSEVYGVIYSEDSDNVITKEVKAYTVTNFDNAYEDASGNPIGVSGKYIP